MSMAIKQAKANAGANFSSIGSGQFIGDPGLFGFIGKALKGVGGAVLGSTPIGGAIGAVAGSLLGRTSPRTVASPPIIAQRPTTFFPSAPRFGPQEVVPKPGVRGAIERFVPGGSTGLIVQGSNQGQKLACPSGFHPNKTSYHTKAGFVPAGSKCVKNRRRNPLNPAAASRAIKRLEAAKRADRMIRSVTIRCRKCGKSSDTCGCR